MLHDIRKLYGDKLVATDGRIGHIKDFYFDDQRWAVRYLVADTGAWLMGRLVLLSPHAFGRLDRDGKSLFVNLTRKEIEDSPPIETHQPVSRQYEIEYYRYYGWPDYWNASGLWGFGGYPVITQNPPELVEAQKVLRPSADKDLQSALSLKGFGIHAIDGEIGSVTGFMVDDKSWAVEELTVEAGHWYSGKEILIPTAKVAFINYEESQVFVKLSRRDIQRTGEHEVAEVGSGAAGSSATVAKTVR